MGFREFQHIADAEMNRDEQCLYSVIGKIINCAVFKKVDPKAIHENSLLS